MRKRRRSPSISIWWVIRAVIVAVALTAFYGVVLGR